MSRVFLAAILAVLLGLLGVMANLVGPSSKEPPKPVESKMPDMAGEHKKMQEAKLKMEQESLKNAMAGKSGKTAAANLAASHRPPPPKPTTQKGMQITSDWFEQRQDGRAGLVKLEQQAKQGGAPQPVLTPVPTPAKNNVLKKAD